jgi:hypothetical protein
MPSQLVYVDLQKGSLCSTSTGTGLTYPKIVAGDEMTLALRFLSSDGNGGYVIDNALPGKVASVRMGLGHVSHPSISGTYKLMVGSKLTRSIDANSSASDIASALNSMDGSAADYVVSRAGSSFLVSRPSGQQIPLSSGPSLLFPVTYCSIEGIEISGFWRYRLTLLPAPLAYSDGSSQILPPPPKVTIIQHGETSPDGIFKIPTIQNIYVPPTFQGAFQLAYGQSKTILLDITSTASEIQAAINKLFAVRGQSVTVSNYATYNCYITFDGPEFMGADIPPLGVNVFSAPPGDWTLSMDTGTDAILDLVLEKSPQTLQFEGEAVLYTESPVEGAAPPPTYRVKLWSVPVSVSRPLLHDDFNAAESIDWIRPRSSSYAPFTARQIITGQQNYTSVVGDGSSSSITVIHNLGTENLASIMVRENSDPGAVLIPGSSYSISVLDANSLRVDFPVPPEQNSIVVSIMACGPRSAFETHTHTIQQIPTLAEALTQISERLAYIESLIPKSPTIVSVTTTMPDQKNVLPPFGEILPDLSLENTTVSIASQIISAAPPAGGNTPAPVVIPGTDLQEQNQKAAAELEKIKAQIEAAKQAAVDAAAAAKEAALKTATVAAKQDSTLLTTLSIPLIGTTADPKVWPITRAGSKPPRLPRAIQGTPVNTAALPTTAGVYRATAPITLPPAPGRKTALVPVNGVFACDGVIHYRAAQWKSGGWYDSDMDRELYRTLISASSFPSGSTLSASLETNTALLTSGFDSAGVSYGCEYILQVLAIPLAAQDPGVGSAAAPAVILETPLSFSMASEKRQFSLTMKRDGSKSSCMVYGASVEGDPVPQGDFTLAVRLTAFDIDDSSENPTGKVSLWMPASQITIAR